MNTVALYIHFPYCLYKCHYCDFNSYAVQFGDDLESPYVETLKREIGEAFECFPSRQINSIFFGGGTPSLFSPKSFEQVLQGVTASASLSPHCEITIEMNPKTVTKERLQGYLQTGINRFSMGVQSFEDRYLSPLGRLHTGEEAREAIRLLREAGVENFNLDLMFAFPRQTTAEVIDDLTEALHFDPTHLSFYNLTLEEGTILKDQHRRGKIRLPENEVQAEMYEEGASLLEGEGLPSYEISNFCRDGRASRHNLAYWRYEDYLGVGAGAVSFVRATDNSKNYGYRWTNPKAPLEYRSYKSYRTYKTRAEPIDYKTAAGEFWMMGLRLSEGVDLVEFERRFGAGLRRHYEERVIPNFLRKNWMAVLDEKASLTRTGRLFANEVVSEFLLD